MSRDHYLLCDVTTDTENTASFYCCVLDRVYRAVAWQRVDQIRYSMNMIKEMENKDKENIPH
jgi:hypothetical protein